MENEEIDIKGLDKAEVLAALFNASRQQGMGFLDSSGNKPITIDDARECLVASGDQMYFDYLRGRVMKISLKKDTLDARLFDRDNGKGAAKRALAKLLSPVATVG